MCAFIRAIYARCASIGPKAPTLAHPLMTLASPIESHENNPNHDRSNERRGPRSQRTLRRRTGQTQEQESGKNTQRDPKQSDTRSDKRTLQKRQYKKNPKNKRRSRKKNRNHEKKISPHLAATGESILAQRAIPNGRGDKRLQQRNNGSDREWLAKCLSTDVQQV